MQYIFMAVVTAVIVGLDQLSKWWIVNNVDLHQTIDGVSGIFSITYVQNTGAAFSSMQGMRWLFVALFVLLTVAVVWEFWGKKLPFKTFDRWCIAAIYAGGLGNIIDRVRLGYVVDMVKLDFMNFPVFNVADCFITCGCILLLVHLVFFNREFWKDEKK